MNNQIITDNKEIVANLEIENIPNILLIGFTEDLQNEWIKIRKNYLYLVVWLQAKYNFEEDPILRGYSEKLITESMRNLLSAQFRMSNDILEIIQRGWTYIKGTTPYKSPRELIVAIFKEEYNTQYRMSLQGYEISINKLENKILRKKIKYIENYISLTENEICKNIPPNFSDDVCLPLWESSLDLISEKAKIENDSTTIGLLKNHIQNTREFIILFKKEIVRSRNERSEIFKSKKVVDGIEYVYIREKGYVKRYQ